MKRHIFSVKFGSGNVNATWLFDQTKSNPCRVSQGDEIEFVFGGTGKLGECVLLSGTNIANEPASPFSEMTPIRLHQNKVVTISQPSQTWGFTLAFTVITDQGTQFQYIPDPELQVGST
ncbi:hypothetical protein ACFFTM_08565 [Pseudoduganella plicata]|uniref:IPT/TIG domain-containing protein n=1 Tax=Pseudoduganella plicata TaxID=321984 RepID=A0A4P7BBL4_9BURK|nr:hypothetical protein [Pseudoduganella plicata]QBQ35463.1 hypothetical protein E1742_04250 [Pseudoduganella plicata]GGZ01983.1 hypothetical protein GCM10007388_39660 [Pseudoduganella plicata]